MIKIHIKDFLKSIETGERTLTIIGEKPEDIYCGTIEYITNDGFQIFVYNDCNYLDYIDYIYPPNEYEIDYGDKCNRFDEPDSYFNLIDYDVSDEVATKRYFFPSNS